MSERPDSAGVSHEESSKPARYAIRFILLATLGLELAACDVYSDSADGQAILLNFFILVCAGLAIAAVGIIDAIVRRVRRSGATDVVTAVDGQAVVVFDMPDNQRVYRALKMRSPQNAEELAASSGVSGHRLEEAVSWHVDQGIAECLRATGGDYSFSTVRLAEL